MPNSDERLLLEVHYNNPTMVTGIKDRTGVAMCTIKTPRPVEAGVITFGTTSIRIPARARDLEVKGTCDGLQTRLFTEPVHLLSSFPHMHTRGVRFSTWINRGAAGVPVVEVKSWDFNHQAAYPHDHANLVINPGESLTTTCVYTNPTDGEIRFGENTENEMCFNFATVYPISAVRALASRPAAALLGILSAIARSPSAVTRIQAADPPKRGSTCARGGGCLQRARRPLMWGVCGHRAHPSRRSTGCNALAAGRRPLCCSP